MNPILRWSAVFLLVATSALADWKRIATGVDYQRFKKESMDIHVARIDLTAQELRIVATPESQRGTRVSEFAAANKAIVAINADFFTKDLAPVGLIVGPCGAWEGTKDTSREGIVAIGDGRAEIHPQRKVLERPEAWMEAVVSGWPLIVRECTALGASQLPGSDAFTRSPHPRTAVGLSKDGSTMYFVVADGRRENVPGLTLSRLARFMVNELDVCAALNLDGGGSSAMWIEGEIVNRPSDGTERSVANHLAVVHERDFVGCDAPTALESPLHSPASGNRQKKR